MDLSRLCIPLLIAGHWTYGQSDSTRAEILDDVVVTATRNERVLGSLPMPVTLIQKASIKTMGSMRLNDVLTEQTGLVVVPQVNGQGSGLQLQGFNPDYTLILIDGEPLVGRTTGTLELSRISIGNIKQIEIVKGPSSSLYGSEALAGVINIITERPSKTQSSFNARYGSNNTLDLNADASAALNKLGIYAFVNRYSSDGYDLSPERSGKTVSPFSNYTFNTKLNFKISPRTEWILSGRYFKEKQFYSFLVNTSPTESLPTVGEGHVLDWNINSTLSHRFSNAVKSTFRLYSTQYSTNTLLNIQPIDTAYYTDDFKQQFLRPEVNTEVFFNEKNISSFGVGYIYETVSTSRYNDENARRQSTFYGFFQHEWTPATKWDVVGGTRYDRNSIYGSQLSPKLSVNWNLNSTFSFKASVGVGFKSPDFRQLYLNFTNAAGGGYSVLGSEVVKEILQSLESQGRIQTYVLDPTTIGRLNAERSLSINAGGHVNFSPAFMLDVNFFRNNINNLIDSRIVAVTTSDQNIYSYKNTQRAFTQGLELNSTYKISNNLTASLGYQLLYAMDRNVVDQIKRGEVFGRDLETLATYRLKRSEYFGLYNRSRHTGNAKLFYENKNNGWFGSLRIIYRGRYGAGDMIGSIQGENIPPSDRNNNAIQDVYDNFVKGYALVNISFGKTIKALRLQTGVDNIFNYIDPAFIPNLPGRLAYVRASYTWKKK